MPRKLIFLFFVGLLTACTVMDEPVDEVRVEATAVSPTPSPTSTAPTATILPTETATAVSPTIAIPSATPFIDALSTAVPTPTPAIPLSEFLGSLEDKLNARDFAAIKDMMPARFVMGVHPTSRHNPTAKNAVEHLAYSYVPQIEPDIVIQEENMILDLAEPFAVETIFRNGQPITAVVPSSGWGPGGTGNAMLYIMLKDGTYTWAGLLASQDDYQAPVLEKIAPPPGLIYRQGDEWWRVNPAGDLEYMFTYTGTLSLNNSGTLALHAETSDQHLTLFHLPSGESETIAIDGTLLHGSWQMPWLDDETAVLIVDSANEQVDQQSMGNLTTLNVLDGTVVTLPPSLSVYDQPSTTGNGDILYNNYNDADQQYNLTLWQDGHEQIVEFDSTLTFNGTVYENLSVYAPVMSPDGRFVVGVRGDGYGRNTFAYVLTDLTNQTSTFIHFFIPTPTDAVLPWGIHWSPDSQWVALDPQSGDFFANSIQLVSPTNPDNNMTLEGITSDPFWLDGWRLIFKQFTGDQTRWRYLDLRTGEQFWLDLPAGAEVVHYVPTN